MTSATDRDYERIFFGDRQVSVTHFHAVNWTEDTEAPISFAFGYWTPDSVYHQGFVRYNHKTGEFLRPVFNLAK
jgi:hypothetical protein